MIAPIFATGCEIRTLTHDKRPAAMIILRFLYNEKMGKENRVMPVATLLLPRKAAKEMMKKFYGVLSIEDEHGGRGEML